MIRLKYNRDGLLDILGFSVVSVFSFFMLLDIVSYPVLLSRELLGTRLIPNSRVFTVRSNAYSSFLGGDVVIIREKKSGSQKVEYPKYRNDFNHSYEKITGDILLASFNKHTKKKKLTKQYIAAKQLFCKSGDLSVTIARTLVLQNDTLKKLKSENVIDCKKEI